MLVLSLTLNLAAPAAVASGPDYFGLGGRWQGAGGGSVAVVEDGTAAMLNPAGLAQIRRPIAGLGAQVAFPKFREVPDLWWDTNRDGVVDERDPPLKYSADPDSVAAAQLHLGRHVGGKFGLGLVAHVPFDTLVRFKTFEPSLPTYPLWDNRLERFALAAGIGGEILPGLSIGAGVDALAAARLEVVLGADVALVNQTGATDVDQLVADVVIDLHEINFRIVPAFAPTLGLQWDVGRVAPPLDGLVVGLAYHGEVGLPIDLDLDLQANVSIDELGSLDPYVTSLIADANLLLFDHYVPQRFTGGLAYRNPTFTLYADVRWTDWSRLRPSIATLVDASLTSPLVNVSDSIRDGNPYELVMSPVVGLRMGSDLQFPEIAMAGDLRYIRLRARGGFGLEPSPLRAQREDTMFLDANRTYFTLGAGFETWDPFELVDGPVRIDLFMQYHALSAGTLPRSTDVPKEGFPVDALGIPIGGNVVVMGAEWSFEY